MGIIIFCLKKIMNWIQPNFHYFRSYCVLVVHALKWKVWSQLFISQRMIEYEKRIISFFIYFLWLSWKIKKWDCIVDFKDQQYKHNSFFTIVLKKKQFFKIKNKFKLFWLCLCYFWTTIHIQIYFISNFFFHFRIYRISHSNLFINLNFSY